MKDIPGLGDTCEGEEFGLKAVGCPLLERDPTGKRWAVPCWGGIQLKARLGCRPRGLSEPVLGLPVVLGS